MNKPDIKKKQKYEKLLNQVIRIIQQQFELGDSLYLQGTSLQLIGIGAYKPPIELQEILKANPKIIKMLLDEMCDMALLKKSSDFEYQTIYKLYQHNDPKGNYIFYAREFNDKTKPVFYAIKSTIKSKLGLEVIMLEDDRTAGSIQNVINEKIRNSLFMIADLSSINRIVDPISQMPKETINSNVMYEMGFAKGCGKKILMIVDQEKGFLNSKNRNQDLPFDIGNHTTMEYERANPNKIIEDFMIWVSSTLKDIQ